MARKTTRTPRAGRTGDASSKSKKAAKPAKLTKTKTKAAAKPALEAVDSGGMGIDEGMVLTTFVLLVCAVVMAYVVTGNQYPT